MGQDEALQTNVLSLLGLYELLLFEYKLDPFWVRDHFTPRLFEQIFARRNQRIRRENGEEEEPEITAMEHLREAARQREMAMRAKKRK